MIYSYLPIPTPTPCVNLFIVNAPVLAVFALIFSDIGLHETAALWAFGNQLRIKFLGLHPIPSPVIL
jgi:hypothetical protein